MDELMIPIMAGILFMQVFTAMLIAAILWEYYQFMKRRKASTPKAPMNQSKILKNGL